MPAHVNGRKYGELTMKYFEKTATVGAKADGEEGTPVELSLLVNVHDVAEMLRCSARHIWRLADSGRMPRPHKVGALRRWDRAAIAHWISQGCPNCRKATRSC